MNEKNKVLKKALSNIAEQLKFDDFQLKKIIGISINEIEQIENSKSFASALLLIEFYKELCFLFGGDLKVIKVFLTSHNKLLNGKPLDIIQNDGGVDFAVTTLKEFRVHSYR